MFLDYRNRANLGDDYIVIYGHRMSRGLMFSDIGNYAELDYFRTHKGGVVFVPGGEFKLETIAFLQPRIDSGLYNLDARKQTGLTDNLEAVLDEASLVDYKAVSKIKGGAEGKIILLSTCSKETNQTRDVLVMFATRVK